VPARPREAGLIRSLSARLGVTDHSLAARSPARAGATIVNFGEEVSMGMLAERVEQVIGVDTHRDSHSAAVCNTTGAVTAEITLAADAFGYRRLLRFAREQAPGGRVWAIESTGSFGAGLTSFLLEQGEWVVEIDRPRGRPDATVPSRTRSTPLGQHERRSRVSTSPSRVDAALGKRFACCSQPVKVPSSRARRRSRS